MREFYKNRGETPLQALDRMRKEQPELASETLSYAGRLDPMAEGSLLVLVGPEENKRRQEYLNRDKIYVAEFLLGCASDTGDVLGLINEIGFVELEKSKIEEAVDSLKFITEQTYPWYSSKTVNGIPLFQYARDNNFNIVRPTREVHIDSISKISITQKNSQKLIDEIIIDISKVDGDFRQSEIIDEWKSVKNDSPENVQVVSFEIKVSSGTYIRTLCEHLSGKLGVPVLLYKLVRTKVL